MKTTKCDKQGNLCEIEAGIGATKTPQIENKISAESEAGPGEKTQVDPEADKTAAPVARLPENRRMNQSVSGLRALKGPELHQQLQQLVCKERKITNLILEHLNEVASRGLYLEMAYSSMFDYAVRGLGYSESAALRRLRAAKLMKVIPAIGQKLESGKLSLSQLEKVARAFQGNERKQAETNSLPSDASLPSADSVAPPLTSSLAPSKASPIKSKAAIIAAIEGKSARETDIILAKELAVQPLKFERLKLQADRSGKLELVFDQHQLQLLEEVRHELGFSAPVANWAEVIAYLARFWKSKASKQRPSAASVVKKSAACDSGKSAACAKGNLSDDRGLPTAGKADNAHSARDGRDIRDHSDGRDVRGDRDVRGGHDERRDRDGQGSADLAPGTAVDSNFFVRPLAPKRKAVPQALKAKIFHRDQCCQYQNRKTGKKCEAKQYLTIDHIVPVWAGGSNDESNLRILCAAHNRFRFRRGT